MKPQMNDLSVTCRFHLMTRVVLEVVVVVVVDRQEIGGQINK